MGVKPEPTPKDEQRANHPRRWYCPCCDREIPVRINLVPVNVDGKANYRIAGFSVPSPCPWCGESMMKEVAVEEAPPIQTPSGLVVPR